MSIGQSNKGLPIVVRPTGTHRLDLPERGCNSRVHLSEDGRTVLKSPSLFSCEGCDEKTTERMRYLEEDSAMLISREAEIYRHLGSHEGILPCLEISAEGLIFPYMKNGSLRTYLRTRKGEIDSSMRMRWARAAVSSLVYIHSKGVLQGDVSAKNILVADDLSLLLHDFAGSALGDLSASVLPESRYWKQNVADRWDVTAATETFAIGSLLYEISTGTLVYEDIEDSDSIEALFRQDIFPPTADIMLGDVIEKCWMGHFETSSQVLDAIEVAVSQES
ncbi:kinase-like protein [Pseudovirgaria hyperparasitica]|uniref:non-specific serine/threonine protein kinase n=1 Tax=Pseudovirgaria hyperparasitica TaxID=470096 RepID=A0A6A6WFX7_9PEZI|nr:kinase-like protein [Pseudovirgaria hyperparasitica]KAF2761698.1 kinase-like protein [Pseudovirgaria hyperparasitica]